MPAQTITVPWGNEELQLELPPAWRVQGILTPAALAGVADPIAEVRRSLAEPIGTPRLSQLAQPGARIALGVDDSSRPTLVSLIAPAVIAELEAAGVRRADITVIPALGLHRAMTEAELAERLGPETFAGLRWENHDCDDASRLVTLGTTSRGTPVLLNRSRGRGRPGCLHRVHRAAHHRQLWGRLQESGARRRRPRDCSTQSRPELHP
ncbi:MAG: lactate racemase domain-containing protein [Anaerolineae bacterium]